MRAAASLAIVFGILSVVACAGLFGVGYLYLEASRHLEAAEARADDAEARIQAMDHAVKSHLIGRYPGLTEIGDEWNPVGVGSLESFRLSGRNVEAKLTNNTEKAFRPNVTLFLFDRMGRNTAVVKFEWSFETLKPTESRLHSLGFEQAFDEPVYFAAKAGSEE